ncbi:MAG: 50S ribosomal protein L11 methyltransferase [Candidatus Rokubacteria bacterium]|nr:50S ribosomal protein L11 methyltransferase [Candidatus Rokubacteria bacterium]
MVSWASDPYEFVRRHLRVAPVAEVPEVRLHQAEEPIGLWLLTEGEYYTEAPPPFWAFAWAGGQGLARYLLDHPDEVAGRAVVDLAAGSGVVAIAAAKAGAAAVWAVEVDPLAVRAIELNASLNDVRLNVIGGDVLDQGLADLGVRLDGDRAPLVVAGDVFYSEQMSARVLTFLRRAARDGADVLVGDPGRAFFPGDYFTAVTAAEMPVRPELESTTSRTVTIWRINPRGAAHRRPR